MIRLMLDGGGLADEFYEPQWGEGVDSAALQNPPEGSSRILTLFTKFDEADRVTREAPSAIPMVPVPTPGADAMGQILIRLVQAQELFAAHGRDSSKISQKGAIKSLRAVPSVMEDGVLKDGARLLA